MNGVTHDDLYRCDLCHGPVDPDTRARAQRAWRPLIICDRCVRDADIRSLATSGRGTAVAVRGA